MNGLLEQSRKFVKRNASTILTVAGGVGVVATTIMAVKATPKAVTLLEKAKEEKGEELTTIEKVQVAWKPYIPVVLTGVGTIACIFGANILSKRQQASLISAYTLIDGSFKDYKKKVEELYGEEGVSHIKEELAKDKYTPMENLDNNKQLFYDEFSKTYFESTMEDVLQAEYEVNRMIANEGGAYLYEFYNYLNIPYEPYAKELGWSQGILSAMYWTYWLDFDHSKMTTDDGRECHIITMRQEPVIDFDAY